MSLECVFNSLGNSLPQILNGFAADHLNIRRSAQISDGAGGIGFAPPFSTNAAPVPCVYKPSIKSVKDDKADRLLSFTLYIVTFAFCDQNNIAYDVRTDDRLEVMARAAVPVQVFRIVGLKNQNGIVWEAVCEKEN